MIFTEDDGRQSISVFYVAIDAEYLPGRNLLGTQLSTSFSERNIAEFSLHHLKEQFPLAKVVEFRGEPGHCSPEDDHYVRAVRETELLREKFAIQLQAFQTVEKIA